MIDEVASQVHLKIATYHDMEGRPTMASADLEEVRWIKEMILNDILESLTKAEEDQWDVNMFDLDACVVKLGPPLTMSSRSSILVIIMHD